MNEATSRPDSEGALRALIVERPGAAVAAILFGLIGIAAMLAPLIAPTNPFDLASLDVLDAELPPRWVQGSDPSFLLGTLIRSGYDLMFAGAWWITVIPGLVLVGLLVSVNVLGDALRDALDPRLSPR